MLKKIKKKKNKLVKFCYKSRVRFRGNSNTIQQTKVIYHKKLKLILKTNRFVYIKQNKLRKLSFKHMMFANSNKKICILFF